MYEFVTGPLAWLAFSVFFVGSMVRVVQYIRGLDWKLDRVTYEVNVSYGIKGALRSIFFWLLPFGTRGWRSSPFLTFFVFTFHIGLLLTPVFLVAHNELLLERWGFRFPSLSEATADFLTILVLVSAIFLVLRRIALPEVRIITTGYDYLLLIIAVSPFFTGLMAHYQVWNYEFWLILHIVSGEIMLVAIPFTKLSHFVKFFLTRAQIGMDFGIKRGGMKNKGLAW